MPSSYCSNIGCLQVIEHVEMQDVASIQAMVETLDAPIDCVINNAGYFPDIHETVSGAPGNPCRSRARFQITDPENPLNFEEELKQIDICAVSCRPCCTL